MSSLILVVAQTLLSITRNQHHPRRKLGSSEALMCLSIAGTILRPSSQFINPYAAQAHFSGFMDEMHHAGEGQMVPISINK